MSEVLLMVTAHDAKHRCLGVRFCGNDGVARMKRLLVIQVRSRHGEYGHMKPREISRALTFDVYEITNPPNPNGYPKWLGPADYYI